MAFLSEADIEDALLAQLLALGFETAPDEVIGPDGSAPERTSHDLAVLRLNPHLPPEAHADAVRRLTQSELPKLLEENHRIHKLLVEGVDLGHTWSP